MCQKIHMVPGIDVESFTPLGEESIPPYFVISEVHQDLKRNVQIGRDQPARNENPSVDQMGTSVDSITQVINETISKLSGRTPTNRNVPEVRNKEMLRAHIRGYNECRDREVTPQDDMRKNTEHCGVHLRKKSTRNQKAHQATQDINRAALSSNEGKSARFTGQLQDEAAKTTRKDVRFADGNAETDSRRGKRNSANKQSVMKTNKVEKERSSRHSVETHTNGTDRSRRHRSIGRGDNITKQNQYQEEFQRDRRSKHGDTAGNNPDEPQRIRTRSCGNTGNAVFAQRETSGTPGNNQITNVPTNETRDESFPTGSTSGDFFCCICRRCTNDEQYVHI